MNTEKTAIWASKGGSLKKLSNYEMKRTPHFKELSNTEKAQQIAALGLLLGSSAADTGPVIKGLLAGEKWKALDRGFKYPVVPFTAPLVAMLSPMARHNTKELYKSWKYNGNGKSNNMNTEKTASIRSKLVKLFPTNKLLQDSALRQQIKLQNAGKKVKADIIGKDLRETNKIQDLKGQVKNLKSISKTKDRETIDVLKNKNKQISDLEGEIKMMDELAPKLLAQKDEEILNFVSKYKKRKKQALTGIGAAGIAGAGGGYLAGREKNAAKILVDFFKSTK